jgi:glycosyltransferase involved in cell wall biosynthesis
MTHSEELVIPGRYCGDSTPDVSIIIPTRNRADQLSRCLHHVGLIRSDRPWELVVVDNGSTDDTAELVGKFARSAPFPVRLVQESVAGGARTRNSAAKVARGEILVFIDDDCYVRPDIIEQYRKIFEEPAIGFAGGRILLHDRTDYPLTINESEVEVRFPAARPVPCGIVQGANMAMRRQALLDAGGFDQRMGPATRFPAEDWDVLTRIGIDGWVGGYFPGPTVSHHHGRKRAEARIRIRCYNIGSGAVYLKLLANARTRRMYLPYILRTIAGDMKFRQTKVAAQIYGAMLFLWQNGHCLLEVAPNILEPPLHDPHPSEIGADTPT